MEKKCWIRSDKDQGDGSCPFGLPITEGCQHAGDSVANMCPLESISKEKREPIEKANKRVYLYYKTNGRCIYTANVLTDRGVVNCDFGDTAAGMSTPAFSGSPLYAQTFSGIGLDGLYAFPLGFYADNNESRNLFQGLFSLVGNKIFEIIKSGTNLELLKKISNNNEPLSIEERDELIDFVENCREKYEDSTVSTSKMEELINKWNPRKKL